MPETNNPKGVGGLSVSDGEYGQIARRGGRLAQLPAYGGRAAVRPQDAPAIPFTVKDPLHGRVVAKRLAPLNDPRTKEQKEALDKLGKAYGRKDEGWDAEQDPKTKTKNVGSSPRRM
jgi:hypothetical protein